MHRAMKRIPTAAVLLAVLAAACTPSKDATPTPEERAICETRCFAKRGTCRADDYDCDRAKDACMRGCRYFD